jgi:AraC-like DNA-binding protein
VVPRVSVDKDRPESLYITARYLRGLLDYVRQSGASLTPVLDAMGLSEEGLRDPDRLIPHALQDDIFAAAERVTGDPNIGLHAGEATHVMHFGIVGQLALTCATGGDLLALQVRYQSLIGNGVRSALKLTPDAAVLEIHVARDPVSRHSLEYTLAAQITLARLLAGPQFAATRFELQHAEPAASHEHRRVFACDVVYGRPQVRLCFPLKVITLPLVGGDNALRPALESEARRRLEALHVRVEHKDSEVARYQRYITERLSGGAPSVEETADAMGTSVRTLQRRLAAHELSYRDLVEGVRREAAETLMNDPSLSLLDVALLLGFSDQTAFNRAFRRWFQTTPTEMRQSRADKA